MATIAELLSGADPRSFRPPKRTPESDCIDRGGTWDGNKCILPEPVDKTPEVKAPTPPSPEGTVTRDAETGEVKGFINSKGNFVQSSRADVEKIVGKQQAKIAPIEGEQTAEGFQQQQRLQSQIGQIGQVGNLTAAQQADINFSQAATAGLANVAPSLIGGAATGALVGGVAGGGVGSTVTAPAGAIIGAVGGATSGFISGIMRNIKVQQRGEIQAGKAELSAARTGMRNLATAASSDPGNADIYIAQYNQILTRLHQARRQVKAETQGDLNAFMEDGRKDLADFDVFLQPGGIADIYGDRLASALTTGVPPSFNGEELLEE